MYLVLLRTSIVSVQDREQISSEMNELVPAGQWSIDLCDEERILRLVLPSNSVGALRALLRKHGFSSELLNIYHLDYGIDFPLIRGERGIPKSNFVSLSLTMAFFSNSVQYNVPPVPEDRLNDL